MFDNRFEHYEYLKSIGLTPEQANHIANMKEELRIQINLDSARLRDIFVDNARLRHEMALSEMIAQKRRGWKRIFIDIIGMSIVILLLIQIFYWHI